MCVKIRQVIAWHELLSMAAPFFVTSVPEAGQLPVSYMTLHTLLYSLLQSPSLSRALLRKSVLWGRGEFILTLVCHLAHTHTSMENKVLLFVLKTEGVGVGQQVDEGAMYHSVEPDTSLEARGHYYIPPVIPPLYDRPVAAPTPTSTRCNTPVWDLDGEKRVRFLEPEVRYGSSG